MNKKTVGCGWMQPKGKNLQESILDARNNPSRWKTLNLPFGAEIMLARERKFSEVILLVHHFGGDRRTVLRHSRLLNSLGFDVIRFDLLFNQTRPVEKLPLTGDFKFGVRHVWANQIESILNAVPGRKIICSFSMPSASAVEAIALRRATDVGGLICDGGPFLQLVQCTWNLYERQYHVRSRVLRATFTAFSLSLWGLHFKGEMRRHLKQIPRQFPVLSIRGEHDPLVPPSAIADFFALGGHLDLQLLNLPEGGHLDGLKRFANLYVPVVENFLISISTRLSI